MDRPTARNGEIRTGWSAGMPRAPLAGVVAGAVGLLWGAAGLVLASWAATAALDAAKGRELALWALGETGVQGPWPHQDIVAVAMGHLPIVAVAAAVALLLAWSGLHRARIAFRPRESSHDGKGELRLSAIEPRVGRMFDGTIMLRDAPAPGEEFDVTLTALTAGGVAAYRAEQRARVRPGAHGANLPFRFDVPATAPASGGGNRWRLEFAPAGRRHFGRSAFEVTLGRPTDAELRVASVPRAEAHVPPPVADTIPAQGAGAAPQADGYVAHVEKLYGALGGKLTAAQRERIRAGLSGREAGELARQLEGLRKLKPDHVKLFKYAAIAAVVLFFVLPFVLSVLGMIATALFRL